jgi:hypothetical protein
MRRYWAEFTLLVLVTVVLLIFFRDLNKYESFEELEVEQLPEMKFGLPVDSFFIVEGKIKPNQNLGDLLTGFGVSMASVDKLAKNSAEVFDVRKIRSGNNFYIFQSPDSCEQRVIWYMKTTVSTMLFSVSPTA